MPAPTTLHLSTVGSSADAGNGVPADRPADETTEAPGNSPVFAGPEDAHWNWEKKRNHLRDWRNFAVYNPATDTAEFEQEPPLPQENDLSSDRKWPVPEEPNPDLLDNGLPAPHSCDHCRHVVINSKLLSQGQRIPLCENRGAMIERAKDGCPLYRWLEWKFFGKEFAKENLTRNKVRFTFALRSVPEQPHGIKSFGVRHWWIQRGGNEYVYDDKYSIFAEKGKLDAVHRDTEEPSAERNIR
jgi:hypothetical protein